MVALFVILLVVIALGVDIIIQTRQKKYPLAAPVPIPASSVKTEREVLRMPKGVFFHPGHTWARILSGEKLEIGIDDFVQKTLGGIEKITFPDVGVDVKQGDPIIALHRGDHTVRVVAPLSGRVVRVNTDAMMNPALVNENPYKDGWLCIIEPMQLASNLSILSIAEDAMNWIRGEVARFREFILGELPQPQTVGITMLDGGIPVTGSMEHLGEKSWEKFETEFLR